jgi:hypothetical protein
MIKKQALSSAFPIAMGFKPIAIFVFFAFAGVVTGKPAGLILHKSFTLPVGVVTNRGIGLL